MPKKQPLQSRKTSLYTSVQTSERKGEGMHVWEGEIVENNKTKQKGEGRGDRRGRQNEEKTRGTDGIVAVTLSSSQ